LSGVAARLKACPSQDVGHRMAASKQSEFPLLGLAEVSERVPHQEDLP
jgi:hypothetical protein